MADKINFGKRTIDALPLPGEGRQRYRDTASRFLYLDVFNSGRKTFLYVRKLQGRVKFIKIGNYPEMTPTEARIKADEQSGDISKGKPLGKSGKTFADLFTNYLENHLKLQARTWKLDERWFNKCLEPLHRTPIKHITPQTVRDFHKKMAKEHGEVSANRIASLISRTFNYAIKEQGAFLANPAAGLTKFDERSRARRLDDIEIKRFFQALDTMDLDWQDFFKLALFTGARRANIQAAKWADIDIERKIWTISEEDFKTGEETEIILSDAACEILTRRLEKSESGYVFPSNGKSGHIVETKTAWRRLLKKSGIKNFHMHDLRRTFGSYQANTGASLQVIGKSLGHRSTDATEIYARLDLAPVRESVEKATAAILAAATKKDNEK
ncbi:MAG: tyrosine-type recombinase/integrase [Victivallales bacterium]